jgi:hypothetical protein
MKGGEAILKHGAEWNPFDAVQLKDVDVVGAHATQTLLQAGAQPVRREIEVVEAESAGLGGKDDSVPTIRQSDAESFLGASVVHRSVNDIDAHIDCAVHDFYGLVDGGRTEHFTNRTRTEGNGRDVESGFTERLCLHGVWSPRTRDLR